MIPFLIVLSVVLAPFASAQSNDTSFQLTAIEAHFKQAQIVPSLFPSFEPTALLAVSYAGIGDITPGQLLTKEQSAPTPVVTATPANSSIGLNGKYTIVMVDADIVGSNLSKGVNRHWLLNGVEFTDGTLTNASATAITAYAGPGPAAGSGPHRYVIILYSQPDTFRAPPELSSPIGVTPFDVNAYAKNSGLGPLVAATYITVEDGTATVSIPVTSPVISSTLAVSQPTNIGTSTPNASTSTASAETPSKTNAAAALPCLSTLGLLLPFVIMITA